LVLLASRQRQLVSMAQLVALGFREGTVRGRVKGGRLHRTLFAGVFSLAPPPLGRLETIKAAALACGPRSLPSCWSATEALGIAEPALLPVHITSPSGSGPSRRNIALHRSVVLPCDTSGRGGILCTSAARTVFDLAATAEPDEVERILIAADSLRILNRRRLRELIDQSPGRRGIRMLRSLIANEPVRVRSDIEVDLVLLCRHAGLPEPVVNGVVAGIEVDLHWPELRLVVEVDGWAFHGGRERMNADRDRDQRLTLAGLAGRSLHPRPARRRPGGVRAPARCARLAAVQRQSGHGYPLSACRRGDRLGRTGTRREPGTAREAAWET
jgi:hypothetical protein